VGFGSEAPWWRPSINKEDSMRSRFPIRFGIVLATAALVLAAAGTVSASPQGRGGSLGGMISTPRALTFDPTPVYGSSCKTVWIKNGTTAYVQWVDWQWVGKDADDFQFCHEGSPNSCFDYFIEYNSGEVFLAPGDSCSLLLRLVPDEPGAHTAAFQMLWVDGYNPDSVNSFVSTTNLKGRAFYEN
jgi:hypothetical protein